VLAAPAAIDVLEAVRDAPTRKSAQPFERQGRPRSVATQSLATEIVARFDAHARVKVTAVALDGERGLVGALVGVGI
jgi:hypothetical protein